MIRWQIRCCAAALLFAAHSAWAQNAQQPNMDAKGCAGAEQLKPGEQGGPPQTEGSGNLSDKLARSNGVLCPPNVDPNITTPAPETGRMPVIPPPGTQGGNPSVQPK
ncbi:MAG TPA: hypothetical protein VFB45_07100 [Pseudolabrys sp.]|nr:hypothetical protein [Pseudolabrys sp.]